MENSEMERDPLEPVAWEKIHSQSYLFEDRCWTTCNGGFCCSNNHPDFQFQLIPTNGTTIIYIEDEYDWLSRNGTVPDPQTTGTVPNQLTFDFGGPRPLSLVQLPCRLLGMCQGVIDKPLLCKIYPMFPVLGIDGDLEDICPASIFELTMSLIGAPTPCTVFAKRKHYFDLWKKAPERLEALRHPYLILYLQAAKHFSDIYRARLDSNAKLRGLTGKEFWKRWELQYLGGALFDGDLFGERVRSTYDDLVRRYGEFLTPA
jgi:hypothetical protein